MPPKKSFKRELSKKDKPAKEEAAINAQRRDPHNPWEELKTILGWCVIVALALAVIISVLIIAGLVIMWFLHHASLIEELKYIDIIHTILENILGAMKYILAALIGALIGGVIVEVVRRSC